MARRGRGRITPHRRGGVYIYVPVEVSGDTSFPFKERGDVSVYVRGHQLVIEEQRKETVYREEAEENYKAYLRAKNELVKEHPGKFVVIARGRKVCIADSAEEAVKIADEEEPGAKHRILWKVGEDEEIRVRRMAGSWLRRRR
ncbi:MAG: hypothetical protein QW231_04300 [Candidatus Bathyarchaeia archaeon]